jgi:hypothetical protein
MGGTYMTFKEAQDAYSVSNLVEGIIVVVLILMTIGLMYLIKMKFFKATELNLLKSFVIALPLLMVEMIIVENIFDKEQNELNNKIEAQYIEKLTKEKMEVKSFRNVDVTDIEIKNHYFTQEESEILALKVRLYKDGIIRERIIKTQVKVVKDLKQAYLEYQILEQDLSPSEVDVKFKKGYYNTTLFIPE